MIKKNISGLFLPYSSDVEFYGYGGNTIEEPVPVSRLEKLLTYLTNHPKIEMVLASEYLEQNQIIDKEVYLKSGSWSSDQDFSLWQNEPDNHILNKLSNEAYELFLKQFHSLNDKDKKDYLKKILLAFNSDGRGWTPIPEHRLFCFNKALEVIDSLGD
jgi:predicted glycosyl hydrolase (DUF1957 family)